MIKLIIYLAIIIALVYAGMTVKLGKRTFFGHISAIWSTPEVQDLKQGVEEKAGPTVERVKRGVKAGVDEADREVPAAMDAGTLEAPADAGVDAPVVDAPPAPRKKPVKKKKPHAEATP